MENSLAILQKVKHRLAIWSTNSTSRYIHPKELKAKTQVDSCTPTAALVTELKGRNNPNVYQWMKKVKVLKCDSLSSVWLFAIPWTVAR